MTDIRTSAPLTDGTDVTDGTAGATGLTGPAAASGLRGLHLVRAAFSLVWVGLVLATSSSLNGPDALTVVAGVLLVAYPLWDVVATLVERRTTDRTTTTVTTVTTVNTVNLALGGAATVAMAVAVLTSLGSALLVFGVWALLSGAVQLTVAVRRRRTVGAQWPMIISGGLSVLAGASIAASAHAATSGLGTVAGYSAFGAFWFLVSALALTVRSRRAR